MSSGPSSEDTTDFRLSPANRRVFAGLMIGMFVASISQTIVGPAMPRIVAELGGMDHYSWIAVAAMLVSAVVVPIVGKLSDIYGRRAFYLAGLVTFMVGAIVAWQAQNFGMLVAARAIQGLGMGTLMPLSQTIIGDIIPPRQRGKYQGLMGSVFGLTSVAGPLAGGWITDAWGWRYLFLVSLPFGVIALFVIGAFLKLDQPRRAAQIDVAGIVTLTVGLVLVLLATSFGGTTWAWSAPETIACYVIGGLALVAFVLAERRAAEPVLPLALFRNRTFTMSVLAAFFVSMMMFGAIIYIPVYAQGVLGVSATNSGLILMPLMIALVSLGILGGMVITRTGRYKELLVLGVVVMAAGYSLLTRMGYESSQADLTLAMAVIGIGLGACLQVFTLVVQNTVMRADMGVGTAAVQFFRNVGSTVGIAVFGTIMTTRLPDAIRTHVPPEAAGQLRGGSVNAGSVLDPAALAKLPPAIAEAVRRGLADSLHDVFLAALPLAAVALLLTLGIKAVPLRDTISSAEDTGREMLDALGSASPTGDGLVPALGRDSGPSRTKERLLGLQLGLLAEEAQRGDRPLLSQAIADVGDGDIERGVALLSRTAVMLTTEDPATAAKAEKYAAEVVARGERPGGALSEDLRRSLATASASAADDLVLATVEPRVLDRYESVDYHALFSVSTDLTATLMVDIRRMRDMLAG